MVTNKLNFFTGILPIVAFVSCAGTPQRVVDREHVKAMSAEEADSRNISNAAAVEAKAHDFVEIQFIPGSSTLSDSAKASLDAVIEQSKKAGKIDEVIVMSWADEEFPSKSQKKLSKEQRTLAENRSKEVERYLRNTQSVEVEAYNMATQSNVFSRWFNTTDSRLKKSLMAAGLPTTSDVNQYPSKASHSVILVKVE